MKILTVVGARPQFIKAAAVSRPLRQRHREILLHTGQHYDEAMSDRFFMELDLPDNANLQLATQLRVTARLRKFRLIALTSDMEHPAREAARAAGFERYLVKPVAQDELDKILCIPSAMSRQAQAPGGG